MFSAMGSEMSDPYQKNSTAEPAGLAVRFTVPPMHIGPLLAGAAVGAGCTVAILVV